MPVASDDWVPHPAKITSSITTVKGATIQSTTTAWMSPYSRASPSERPTSNNNNNNNGVVILEGCRPPAATTARRFLRWFSRLGQPPIGKSGKFESECQRFLPVASINQKQLQFEASDKFTGLNGRQGRLGYTRIFLFSFFLFPTSMFLRRYTDKNVYHFYLISNVSTYLKLYFHCLL